MTRSLAELEDYLFCLSSSHQFVKHAFCFLVDIIRELRAHSTLTEIVIRSNLKAFATNGFLLTEQLVACFDNSMDGCQKSFAVQRVIELTRREIGPHDIRVNAVERDTFR